MLRTCRLNIMGPIGGRWFVTPLLSDGGGGAISGEPHTFDSCDAALEFAAVSFPGIPLSQIRGGSSYTTRGLRRCYF